MRHLAAKAVKTLAQIEFDQISDGELWPSKPYKGKGVRPQKAMAFDALEIMIIGVIVVVIFLWGPQKIPEVARALGRAKREFDSASKEIGDTVSTMANPPRPKTADEILIDTARQLGMATEGMTREQISREIFAKNKQQ